MKYWHKLVHKPNWYSGRIVSKLNDDGDVMIGFQCDKCGLIDDWHVARLDKQIDLEIKKRVAARPGVRNG